MTQVLSAAAIERVLVAVDDSAASDELVETAIALAAPFHAEVTVMRVLGDVPQGWDAEGAAADRQLTGLVMRLWEAGLEGQPVTAHGTPSEEVVRRARDGDADVIVLSARGEGGAVDRGLGSTASKLVRCRDCSLAVVPVGARPTRTLKTVLVPLDGAERTEDVLPLVQRLATHHGARVVLCHALRPLDPMLARDERAGWIARRAERQAHRYLRRVASELHGDVDVRVARDGNAFRALQAAVRQEDADLVVLSAHGHTADEAWAHGSMAARFIEASPAPVLVLQDMRARR